MLEYRDNYADTTGSLYQYKRPEPRDNNGTVVNLGTTLELGTLLSNTSQD